MQQRAMQNSGAKRLGDGGGGTSRLLAVPAPCFVAVTVSGSRAAGSTMSSEMEEENRQ